MADPATRRRLRRRITAASITALALGVTAFLLWCGIDYDATAAEYDSVTDDAALVVAQHPHTRSVG